MVIRALLGLLCLLTGQLGVADTKVPSNAAALSPIIYSELVTFFPEHPYPTLVWALIQKESCIHTEHPRCFKPTAQLRTLHRNGTLAELGVGIGQVTFAQTSAGRVRVDTAGYLRKKYPTHLRGMDINTLHKYPELQVRALVLMTMESWHQFSDVKNEWDRLAFMDSAYNGGGRDVRSAQRVCGMTRGCNPHKWFGHVEIAMRSIKNTNPGMYSRSYYQINTDHVRDVLLTFACKYQPLVQRTMDDYWARTE